MGSFLIVISLASQPQVETNKIVIRPQLGTTIIIRRGILPWRQVVIVKPAPQTQPAK